MPLSPGNGHCGGMTLLEVLTGITLGAVVMAAGLHTFRWSVRSWIEAGQAQSRAAEVQWLSRELRLAWDQRLQGLADTTPWLEISMQGATVRLLKWRWWDGEHLHWLQLSTSGTELTFRASDERFRHLQWVERIELFSEGRRAGSWFSGEVPECLHLNFLNVGETLGTVALCADW
jgi:type II secretory pathway pseudopilin PulG